MKEFSQSRQSFEVHLVEKIIFYDTSNTGMRADVMEEGPYRNKAGISLLTVLLQ